MILIASAVFLAVWLGVTGSAPARLGVQENTQLAQVATDGTKSGIQYVPSKLLFTLAEEALSEEASKISDEVNAETELVAPEADIELFKFQ